MVMSTLNLKFYEATAEEKAMHKLSLRRMKQWKTYRNYIHVLPIVLLLQVIHDEHEFLQRSI